MARVRTCMCVCLRMAASPGALGHDALGALLLRLYSNHPNGAAGLLRCVSITDYPDVPRGRLQEVNCAEWYHPTLSLVFVDAHTLMFFFGFVVGSPTVCTLSSTQTKDEARVRSPRSSPWKTSLIPHRHPVDYISTNLYIEPRRCDASWRPDTYVYHSIYCLSLLQHYWLSNWCVRGRSSAELRDI